MFNRRLDIADEPIKTLRGHKYFFLGQAVSDTRALLVSELILGRVGATHVLARNGMTLVKDEWSDRISSSLAPQTSSACRISGP